MDIAVKPVWVYLWSYPGDLFSPQAIRGLISPYTILTERCMHWVSWSHILTAHILSSLGVVNCFNSRSLVFGTYVTEETPQIHNLACYCNVKAISPSILDFASCIWVQIMRSFISLAWSVIEFVHV